METTKRLYRPSNNRRIGGVAAGLGEYFNLDPILVRILFVLLSLGGGPGILLYIVLWIVMPDESKTEDYEGKSKRKNRARKFVEVEV